LSFFHYSFLRYFDFNFIVFKADLEEDLHWGHSAQVVESSNDIWYFILMLGKLEFKKMKRRVRLDYPTLPIYGHPDCLSSWAFLTSNLYLGYICNRWVQGR